MTDPKNPEAQNEELDLEQLEEAAGGLGTTAGLVEPHSPRRTSLAVQAQVATTSERDSSSPLVL